MPLFTFSLSRFLLRILSCLPFLILYGISEIVYFILRYIIRYRLEVVKDNLQRSFPQKSVQERLKIERAFYHHLSDLLVEDIKMIRLTPEQLSRRVPLLNPEILDKYRIKGKSLIVMGAHYGNWEWSLGIVNHLNYKTHGVYKPLSDPRFNVFVNQVRTKFGSEMVSMRDIFRVLLKSNKEKIPSFNVFIADQSPVWEEIQYWLPFLNQITPVYLGPEKLAKQFDMVVLYGKIRKTGRGKYSVELIPIEENPVSCSEFEITNRFFQMLEESIKEAPEFWLWSHRRWKLSRKREMQESQGIIRFNEKNTRI